MRYINVLIFLSLFSCGRHDSGDDSQPSSTSTTAKITGSEVQEALYLDDLSQLGACDISNVHQLVYVQEDSQFHSCQKSGWMVVTIKGKDGTNGTNGTNGSNGKNGNPINQYWQDPVTGRNWFFGGQVSDTWNGTTLVTPSCPQGYTMPTITDAVQAWSDGIGAAMNIIQIPQSLRIQVNLATYTYGAYYKGGDSTAIVSIASQGALYNLACYQ